LPDVGGQKPYSIVDPGVTCVRPKISVAKPRRGVGSAAGLAGALGDAPAEADGAIVAAGEPEAAGAPLGALEATGEAEAAAEPDAAGEPLAAGAVEDGTGVAVGVGVARIDGRGVSDSTGPGVNSESQIHGLAVELWKKTNPSTRTPTRAAPPMIRPR
jgi:hypothetical protein